MDSNRVECETALQGLCSAGDFAGAATALIECYGAEVLAFLRVRLPCEADADDVFAVFCEDVWRGLPGFAFRCPARAWAYALARNAQNRYLSAGHRRPERNVELVAALHAAADRARTSTALHQRTDVKDGFRRLRDRLGDEDQLVLLLRVDRDMGWSQIAQVLAGGDGPAGAELERETVRLRKRFQLIKTQLRRWAEQDGLLQPQLTGDPLEHSR